MPMKVIEIHSGYKGLVELEGSCHVVNLSLVDNVRPGDYVIVHAGFAIETLVQEEAHATLALFDKIARSENHEPGGLS